MFLVGELLHRAKSGRLIVRLSEKVEPGTSLFDSNGKKVGKVVELIGPTAHPYASLAPTTSRTSGVEGKKVFID